MQRRDFIKSVVSASAVALASYGKVMAGEQAQTKGGPEKKNPLNIHGNIKKIDFYTHIVNGAIVDFLEKEAGQKAWNSHPWRLIYKSSPALDNVDMRLQLMDKYGIDLQVLTPSGLLETIVPVYTDPKLAARAARVYNDAIAKFVAQSPKRFCGVAILPTTNPEIMMAEFERAINELGFVGTLIHVGPELKRPDHKDYEPLYRKSAEVDVPIWIHPYRTESYPEYLGESKSKYDLNHSLGWPMDSSVAMTYLIFNGVFERYPNLKFIIHHAGAFITFFASRMQEGGWAYYKHAGRKYDTYDTPISWPYSEHFKHFYVDTATSGYEPLFLQRAYEFFGPDHVLFGTDYPYSWDNGETFVSNSLKGLEAVSLPETDRKKIFTGNALKLLKRV